MPRFFVRPEAVDGDRVRFDAEETHHLARVLRLGSGALLEATDGAGRSFVVRLEDLGPAAARGVIVGDAGPSRESPCAITLGQAVLKGERMAWLVQKVTELGVARLVPLLTARVVAGPPAERAGTRRVRWERVAREAVKQCGRAVVPIVEPPRGLAELLAEAPRHDLTWLCREGAGTPAGRGTGAAGCPRRVLLLVGPEGGFSPEEVRAAEDAGARIVGLGPRTLRAESAGIVAVALCQHLFGDLGPAADAP